MADPRVSFTGTDGVRLAGVLDLPHDAPVAYAVFAHCFTCGKDSHASARISNRLTSRGIAVLRFDFAGFGESGGDFEDTTFSSSVEDLVLAAGWLREHHGAPRLLVGHSLGGAAVLAAAGSIPEVAAVVTVAAPADPAHITRLLDPRAVASAHDGTATVVIGGRELSVSQALLDDLAEQCQAPRIAALGSPLLVMHAPQDETVGVEQARVIFEAARHPKSFVALDGADHLLSRPADSAWAADLIATWAGRHLSLDDAAGRGSGDRSVASDVGGDRNVASAGAGGLAEGTEQPAGVVVTETGEGSFAQVVRAGRHTWTADEPTSVPGGTDTGPSPYELVLAGLGACTGMTLRMYARRKEWDVGRITVTVRAGRVHGHDAGECAAGADDGCLDGFSREIAVEGELTDVQRDTFLAIADKCPVHRSLESGSRIATTFR